MLRNLLDQLPGGAACEVMTGLVDLHACARGATLQCARCGKFMCTTHQVALAGGLGMQCTECHGLGDDGDDHGADDAGALPAAGAAGAFSLADRKGLAAGKDDKARDDAGRSGFGDS